MAAASNPTHSLHSPRSTAASESWDLVGTGAAAGFSSPKSRNRGRVGGGTGVSSPRGQVVRGADIESNVSASLTSSVSMGIVAGASSPPPPPLSLDSPEEDTQISGHGGSPLKAGPSSSLPEDGADEAREESSENGNSGGNSVKKLAWNKLSNVAKTEVASVMDAESWPALSASTRASPKTSSFDLLRTLSDGSLPAQVTNSLANPNSTSNHAPYNRQRSMNRSAVNSSNNAASNGQLSSPRNSSVDTAPSNSGKHATFANDSSPRESIHQEGGQRGGFGSHSHRGNDHQLQRNSFRRGNGGPQSSGDGIRHNDYVGRRSDRDHANQDWNPNRNFHGRDTHVQPQRVPSRPSIRGPPPPPPPFLPTPMSVHPFGVPVVYSDVRPMFFVPGPHPDSLRSVSLGPPIVPMVYTYPDAQLHANILSQIDYYFSNENLIKDIFLRKNMDDQGWIPIKLIASFKKVMQLTDNIQLILDAVRSSSIVEVEGERVRRRNDWMRWIMPPSLQHSTLLSPKSSEDLLAGNLQSTILDDKTPNHSLAEASLSPTSGDWSSYPQYTVETTNQVSVQAGVQASVSESNK